MTTDMKTLLENLKAKIPGLSISVAVDDAQSDVSMVDVVKGEIHVVIEQRPADKYGCRFGVTRLTENTGFGIGHDDAFKHWTEAEDCVLRFFAD